MNKQTQDKIIDIFKHYDDKIIKIVTTGILFSKNRQRSIIDLQFTKGVKDYQLTQICDILKKYNCEYSVATNLAKTEYYSISIYTDK